MSRTDQKNASYKGDVAETLFMAECIMRGYSVSVPFGHDNLYDLIVEGASGKLYKVQIKMSRTNQFSGVGKYRGKVDVFAFLCNNSTWVILTTSDLTVREYRLRKFTLNLSKKLDFIEKFDIFG